MDLVLFKPEQTASQPSFGAIEHYPPGRLKPWPTNARKHPENQLAKLKASITNFGFYAPVVVDDTYVILAGHGKTLAALELELPTVPIRMVFGLSESQKRALVIADNKMAHLSTWDEALLKTEIEVLIQDNFEVELTALGQMLGASRSPSCHLVARARKARCVGGSHHPKLAAFAVVVTQHNLHRASGAVCKVCGIFQGAEPKNRALYLALEGVYVHRGRR